jgi:uncharacterized damage-inducible protein DinB
MSKQALTELLRGKGAHADPIACVEDISAETAARRVEGFPHSIADLVFHMNFWMNYDLRRARGEKPKYPEHNAGSFPPAQLPIDAAEWDRLRRDFAWFLAEHARLSESSPEELERKIDAMHEKHNELAGSLEAMLWQTAVHNSYHVGQIAMIRRVLGVWPPKGGGDTW